jgi:predicted CoA-binding protein
MNPTVAVFEERMANLEGGAGAVAIGAGTLWCQFGVINSEGNQIAADAGLTVIADRCLKIEHARYVGRMHWLGFSTQRITSVRTGLQ